MPPRRRNLGVTARKGARTGAIEVDDAVVKRVTKDIIGRAFKRCPDGIQPRGRVVGFEPALVRDIATGLERPVQVEVAPLRVEKAGVGAGGSLRTTHMSWAGSSESTVSQTMVVKPVEHCGPAKAWRQSIQSVVHHELAHAAEPLVTKTRQSTRYGDTWKERFDYYNSPSEVTAYLAEVRHELAARVKKGGCLPGTPTEVLKKSPTFAAFGWFFNPKARRRFLKIAADFRCQRGA